MESLREKEKVLTLEEKSHVSSVCWTRREKDVREKDGVRGRETIIGFEGKRAQVQERKAESEESASDEEGVASIGEGSTVWGGTRQRRGEGEEKRYLGARARNYRISSRLVPAFVRHGSTVI